MLLYQHGSKERNSSGAMKMNGNNTKKTKKGVLIRKINK